jgi:hypothetical protein
MYGRSHYDLSSRYLVKQEDRPVAKPAGDNLVKQAYYLIRHIPGRSHLAVPSGTYGNVLNEWKSKSPQQILGQYINDLGDCKETLISDRRLAISNQTQFSKQDFDDLMQIYLFLGKTYDEVAAAKNSPQKLEDNQKLQNSFSQIPDQKHKKKKKVFTPPQVITPPRAEVAKPAGNLLDELSHLMQIETLGNLLEKWKEKSPEEILGKYIKELEYFRKKISFARDSAIVIKDFYPQKYEKLMEIYNLLEKACEDYVTTKNSLQKPNDYQERLRFFPQPATPTPDYVAKPAGDNLVDQAYHLVRHIPGTSNESVQKGTVENVLKEWSGKSPEQILGKYIDDSENCKRIIMEDRGLAITNKDRYSKQDFKNLIEIYNLLDKAYKIYVATKNSFQTPEDNKEQQKPSFNT